MTESKGLVMAEQVHRYPLWIRLLQQLLCGAPVIGALWWFATDLLHWLWGSFGNPRPLLLRFPALAEPLLDWLGPRRPVPLTALLPSLAALFFALFFALLLRNALPTIRTSARGLLVEFAGDWLPVPWESLSAARVTRGARADRFVLLAETERTALTGWHRLYTLIYRARLRRGLLISSAISGAEQLVSTMLSETDRAVKLFGAARAIRLQEHDTSPLFSLFLGRSAAPAPAPATERIVPRTPAAPAATPAEPEVVVEPDSVRLTYPRRLQQAVGAITLLLVAGAVLRYVALLFTGLVLVFPILRQLPLLDLLRPLQGQIAAPWWPPIAAHLAAAGLLGLALLVWTLLPALETRRAGLAVRHLRTWLVVPWTQIKTIKETALGDDASLALIQTGPALPFVRRLSSLIYDGSTAPGVPIASFAQNAAPLLDRVVTETARNQQPTASLLSAPIVQSEATSDLLALIVRPGPTIDVLTDDARRDEDDVGRRRWVRALAQMALLTGLPALLIVLTRAVGVAVPPDGRLLGVALLLFVIGLLEWPVAVLTAQVLQERSQSGEPLGLKPFPLYPLVQLPRALALVAAIALALLGVPLLPTLIWGGAALWSFLLAAGLWESLYGMRGTRLLAAGAVTVGFQAILIITCALLGLLG